MSPPVRLLIVDDSRAVVSLLRLSLAGAVEIVGAAATGAEAVAMSRDLEPEVVLLDMHLPDQNGVAVLEKLLSDRPDLRVLVFAGSTDHIESALALGAEDCLLKGSSSRDSMIAKIKGTKAPASVMNQR